MIQEFVDTKTDARTFVFYANDPDLVQIKTGKGTHDVAVAPTKKKKRRGLYREISSSLWGANV